MHHLIHHTKPDGSKYSSNDSSVKTSHRARNGVYSDNEVFSRLDGMSLPVEYWSYPVVINEECVGSVVTFLDITEQKKPNMI